MEQAFKFIEVNYHYHGSFNRPAEAIALHRPSNLFVFPFQQYATIMLVKHIDFEGSTQEGAIRYYFFRSNNHFYHIPKATHKFIRNEEPDLILVQGFIFPLQVIALALRLKKKTKIVLQHQGEIPFNRKRIFQKIADRFIDAYIFTSRSMADEWMTAGVIRNKDKCFEINPSTTNFASKDKSECRKITGINGEINFLWVGRLNKNKDPLTVLKAFAIYFGTHPGHKLYMVYGEEELLEEIQQYIQQQPVLQNNLVLLGVIAHTELENWYNGADYFISGSQREGGSYALTEAMACGCIPIVTNIPAAMKSIDNGRFGYYYNAGDQLDLLNLLTRLDHSMIGVKSDEVQRHFTGQFSAAAIAGKFAALYEQLRLK